MEKSIRREEDDWKSYRRSKADRRALPRRSARR
jgi:hypothetical protein